MSSHDSRQRAIARAAAVGLAIGVSAAPATLEAADLDSMFVNPPTQVQPVEFGTGWYIRGDLGYANDSLPPLSSDLSQYLSSARTSSLIAGLGFGYKFTNWLRSDLTLDYRKTISAAGQGASKQCTTGLYGSPPIDSETVYDDCTPYYASSIRRWDLMANLYADIGTWYGITPYIGGGVGLSLTRATSSSHWYMSNGNPYHVTTDGFYFNWDTYNSDLRYQFAWALMAGVSYPLMDHLLIDVGYRYINLGTLPSIADQSGQIVNKSMNAHELRVGLRYMID
jgi:opacity protein-like surface antigen